MSQDRIVVSCDWKSPQQLVAGLVKQLPQLGLYGYENEADVDNFSVLISKVPLSPEQLKKAWEEEKDG